MCYDMTCLCRQEGPGIVVLACDFPEHRICLWTSKPFSMESPCGTSRILLPVALHYQELGNKKAGHSSRKQVTSARGCYDLGHCVLPWDLFMGSLFCLPGCHRVKCSTPSAIASVTD